MYIFWNYHEASPGVFDFSSGNHNVAAYIRAVRRYVARLSKEIRPLLCSRGGPIMMVQVENEYGSYGNDKTYLHVLHNTWKANGINVPFYSADGPTPQMLEAGGLAGAAIGLDSGSGDDDFELAKKWYPGVPSFRSETYRGWLTHWKEKWAKVDTADLKIQIQYLLEHKKSFNLYVVHGGTNFGFTAGANAFNPKAYEPDITSYDYDAPINEQGMPTPKYFMLRRMISSSMGRALPDLPPAIPQIAIPPVTITTFFVLSFVVAAQRNE